MNPAAEMAYVVRLGCFDDPANPDTECRVFLPRQSPLGTFEYPRCQPTGEWPVTFLCLRHGHLYRCPGDRVRPGMGVSALGLPTQKIWRIDCECAHENCGRIDTIYIPEQPDLPTLAKNVLKKNPTVPCGSHLLGWRMEDLMSGVEIAHGSPVR